MSKKANCELKITENFLLAKAYGNIYFVNQQKLRDYRLLLKKPGEVRNDFLHIRTEKDSSDRNIFESDYPLIIRNAKNNDQTKVSDHEISIKRLFIDWKMPKFVRRVWPVIENNDGKLIYIPRYRDYYVDNHKTKFVIDLDYFLIK